MSENEGLDTKERILQAAENLFTDQGFGATSLRAITHRAGVNLAAVNYHFGSKDALIEAVFSRRLGPLNRERLELLDALEASGEMVPLDRIVESFVGPALRMAHDPSGGPVFMRLLGQTISQPRGTIRETFLHQFDEVFPRFTAAIGRCLDGVPPKEVVWRFMFMIGAMGHTMAMSGDMELMSGGLIDSGDVEGAIRRLVPFISEGLRAETLAPDGAKS